jgi:hypothetical protein
MTLWNLLTAIAFTTAIVSGWLAGKSAGITGILIGLIIGVIAGIGGMWSMYHAGWIFDRWLTAKKLAIKIQILTELVMDAFGLAWCFVIGGIVQGITRLLIHYVAA